MTRYKHEFVMRGSGDYVNETAGETLGEHKLVYRGVDGNWYLADADAAATMPVLGITMGAISIGKKGEILLEGYIGDNSWSWTGGSEVYASTTPGELTATAPAGAGDIVQVVAIAVDQYIIQFHGNVGGGGQGGSNTVEGHTAYLGFDPSKNHFVNYFYCDGTADDVQLQAAIDYVEALTHDEGSIFCEAGVYDITARSTFTDPNISLIGTGKSTQFVLAANTDNNILRTQTTAVGFRLEKIYFDGNGPNQGVSNVTIAAIRGDDSIVIDCEFYDAANSGFAFDGVSNCYAIRNYSHDNFAEGCGVVSLTGASSDIWFIENICENNGTEGIIVSDAGGNGVTDVHCIGNRLIGNTNKGIQVSNGADKVYCIGNIATGNDIGINVSGSTGVRDSTDIQLIGNRCEDNTGVAGIGLSRVERYIVADNLCLTQEAANARGIYILGCTKGEIHDNVCEDNAGAQLQLTDSGAVLSTYNDVHNNYLDGGTYGIFEGGSSDNNRIKDNTLINNATAPASIAGADTIVEEFTIWVSDPDSTIGTHPSADLPDGADTVIYAQIPLPLEFQDLVTAQVLVVPGGTGNIRHLASTNWGKVCAGETYNAGSDSLGATEVAVTQNQISCLSITGALDGIASGDLIGLQWTRQGSNAGDTVNADCDYLGVRVRYV